MSSSVSNPLPSQKPPLRGDTASSSTVAIAQRVLSPLPGEARRASPTNPGPQSPRIQGLADSKFKRIQGQSRPSSIGGISEGIGNLNRWSQSTASSKSSATNPQRRNSFARRLSGSFGSISGHNNSQSPATNKNSIKKVNPPPTGSPQRVSGVSLPKPQEPVYLGRLPPLVTLPALSQAVEAAHTPLSAATATSSATDLLPSATYMPGNGDFFGDSWSQMAAPNLPNTNIFGSTVPQPRDDATSAQIKPGAMNSFTPTYPSRAEPPQLRRRPSNSNRKDQEDRSLYTYSQKNRQTSNGIVNDEDEESNSHRERGRRRKAPSQKEMLSRALQKANHAVVLDNAQNFEGAMDAYGDACDLLKQVMLRSSGNEDKKKLDAIRNTYTNRIKELQANELSTQSSNDKALPDVPINGRFKESEPFSPATDDEEEAAEGSTAATMRVRTDQSTLSDQSLTMTLTRDQLPPRRQSLMPMPSGDDSNLIQPRAPGKKLEGQNPWKFELQQQSGTDDAPMSLSLPLERSYIPPPLSPHRPYSPISLDKIEGNLANSSNSQVPEPTHSRHATAESTSWLDTIDESGDSSNSSVHSRTSSVGLRRKHIRTGSGATEAEFDAALDAAVEAAYDDGYEPALDTDSRSDYERTATNESTNYISNVRRNVDIAKQRVREAEREAAIVVAKEREKRRRLEHSGQEFKNGGVELDYEDYEAEEEERMLEDMTKDYILDDANYDTQSKSALPRQSGSSGFSGRAWGSSIGSMPTTIGTPLSTVAETLGLPPFSQGQGQKGMPPVPPPSIALPPPPGSVPANSLSQSEVPKTAPSLVPSLSLAISPGVRDRRLSGQKVKQLKIDTNARLPSAHTGSKTQPHLRLPPTMQANNITNVPKSTSLTTDTPLEISGAALQQANLLGVSRQVSSPFPNNSPAEALSSVSSNTSILSKARNHKDQIPSTPASPARTTARSTGPGALRKNFSSSSLKSLRQPAATPPATDDPPGTPLSRVFSSSSTVVRNGSLPAVPDLPTPSVTNLAKHGLAAGSISFLDNDIHSPHVPGSPNPSIVDAPLPLEPCPESFLLRPFWLMRAIYQTIAHPRGGYISTRLFVPRDAWRVKNVKLKNVEEKVSNCDLLTAALLNLSKVDTLDADAMLEEMQAFELVLDQVQGQLGKKLGTDVGVSGSAAIFKASPIVDEAGSIVETLGSKSTNTSSKSYLPSWRKLGRTKNTNASGHPSGSSNAQLKDSVRETLTMRSLPMTAAINPRFAKRDSTKVLGIGPHSHYMAALGRLCDAVQVLDQIARQVEDPGLRLTSQTHVGLELCTRHAAEFFAFFVCRFALTDIGMMLDKYVKRGSEWVMT